MSIQCHHCGEGIEEIHDTTYSNYNSGRCTEGQHTGDIYRCPECDELTIDNFLSNTVYAWNY